MLDHISGFSVTTPDRGNVDYISVTWSVADILDQTGIVETSVVIYTAVVCKLKTTSDLQTDDILASDEESK